MNTLFTSILADGTITAATFFACTAVSLIIGLFIAFVYRRAAQCSKSFLVTLALLPVVIELVIMLVNGSIGAGIAVAGAFSLVRFRSAQGKGQEITAIFLTMAVGLATGMGYLAIAVLFAVIVMAVYLLLLKLPFEDPEKGGRQLKITVPESLDFEVAFDDILNRYTEKAELVDVRTTGMGSLYKLTYNIVLRKDSSLHQMMDEMRCRNGNLEIVCSRPVDHTENEL